MAVLLQLIVVYDADVRVQHRRPDITRIVVDTVDFKYLLHSFSPFMEHKTQSCKNSESVQVSTKFTPQPTSHPPRMGSPVWRPWPTPPASTPAAIGSIQWNKLKCKYLRTGDCIYAAQLPDYHLKCRAKAAGSVITSCGAPSSSRVMAQPEGRSSAKKSKSLPSRM